MIGNLLACLMLVGIAFAQVPVPNITNDFSANFTISEGPIQHKGYYIHDVTGQRTYRYVEELNQSTYVFQSYGESITYSYTITSSGCTCHIQPNTFIENFFLELAVAHKSKNPCNGTSGELWVPSDFAGLKGVSTREFCISGGVPKYVVEEEFRVTSFTNFAAGRKPIPVSPMDKWVDECSNVCL